MLTKIFVVLLSVFSIAFTSIAVAFVARTANWRETAERYKEHAQIADTNLRHAHAAHAAEIATLRDDGRELQRRIGDLEVQLQGARTEVAQVRADLAQAQSEKSSVEAINRGLLAQLQVADTARSEYQRQRDSLEQRNIELERRGVDLNDRVNELTAQLAVLLEQKRQYEQQINILRTENEKLSQAHGGTGRPIAFESPEGAAIPGVTAVTPVSASAIRGRVREIEGDLITLSVGSADGVKKDMVFVIHREGTYVGDVKISAVEPNQAAGRLVRSAGTPSVNDLVTDATWLAGSRP
jgi:hypothetical protein